MKKETELPAKVQEDGEDEIIYRLQDLKEFIAGLTPEQLVQRVRIAFVDEPVKYLEFPWIVDADIYANKTDWEDSGTIKELMELHGDDFNMDNYRLSALKGTIFFS